MKFVASFVNDEKKNTHTFTSMILNNFVLLCLQTHTRVVLLLCLCSQNNKISNELQNETEYKTHNVFAENTDRRVISTQNTSLECRGYLQQRYTFHAVRLFSAVAVVHRTYTDMCACFCFIFFNFRSVYLASAHNHTQHHTIRAYIR